MAEGLGIDWGLGVKIRRHDSRVGGRGRGRASAASPAGHPLSCGHFNFVRGARTPFVCLPGWRGRSGTALCVCVCVCPFLPRPPAPRCAEGEAHVTRGLLRARGSAEVARGRRGTRPAAAALCAERRWGAQAAGTDRPSAPRSRAGAAGALPKT